jgi:hypothetical protein
VATQRPKPADAQGRTVRLHGATSWSIAKPERSVFTHASTNSRLKKFDLKWLSDSFFVVAISQRDQIIEYGLTESARLGHEMARWVGAEPATFICLRCLLPLKVGNGKVISAPAATTSCQGQGRIAT